MGGGGKGTPRPGAALLISAPLVRSLGNFGNLFFVGLLWHAQRREARKVPEAPEAPAKCLFRVEILGGNLVGNLGRLNHKLLQAPAHAATHLFHKVPRFPRFPRLPTHPHALLSYAKEERG